jgi:hypothetical protein
MASSLRLLGRIYSRAGQGEDAAQVLERATSLYRDSSDSAGASLCRIHLARLLLAEGRLHSALKHLEQAGNEAEQEGLPLALGLHKLVSAQAHFAATKQLNRELAAAAEEILGRGEYLREVCEVKLLLARGAVEGEDLALARAALGELDQLLASVGSKEQQAEADYLRIELELAAGDKGPALRKLRALEQWATNNIFPQIAARCQETLRELALARA